MSCLTRIMSKCSLRLTGSKSTSVLWCTSWKAIFFIQESYYSTLAKIQPWYNLWIKFCKLLGINKGVLNQVSTTEQYIHLSLSAKQNGSSSLLVTTVLFKTRKRDWWSLLSLAKWKNVLKLIKSCSQQIFQGISPTIFLIPIGTMQL